MNVPMHGCLRVYQSAFYYDESSSNPSRDLLTLYITYLSTEIKSNPISQPWKNWAKVLESGITHISFALCKYCASLSAVCQSIHHLVTTSGRKTSSRIQIQNSRTKISPTLGLYGAFVSVFLLFFSPSIFSIKKLKKLFPSSVISVQEEWTQQPKLRSEDKFLFIYPLRICNLSEQYGSSPSEL